MRSLFCAFATCLVALLASPSLHAGELLLGAVGKSAYQIVVPDEYVNDKIEASVDRAAKLMQDAFAAQDVSLEIVTESKASADKPSIYVGNTRFAGKHGVTFEAGQGWTYTWKAVGKNVIVAGNDQPDPIALDKRRPRESRQGGIPIRGTLKSVCEFLYSHVGTRFLEPDGDRGIEYLPTPVIFVPDDLNVTKTTYARNVEIEKSGGIYAIANGMAPSPLALTNFGHYFHTAIHPDTHGETHPKYFNLRGGRRQTTGMHLCYSNPGVQETIYQQILKDADTGYTLIELGQNDGFIPCDCKACYELYDIHPTHKPDEGRVYYLDAAWNEKLWIMMRNMALRLQKDRPNVTLMLSAYSVTRQPPKTIKSFPENVMIQIMGPTEELFEKWNKLDVPGGFAVYLYTWGTNTPKKAGRYQIQELVELLVSNDVRTIQINGKPYIYGIDGMNIYVFHRMMNDPHAKPIDALFDEYLQAAYGRAAGAMSSFFRKLNQRLMFLNDARTYSHQNRDPMLHYSTLYTPKLMNALESDLTSAEELADSEKVRARLAATRLEFDFIKHIINVTFHYYAYLLQDDPATYERTLAAVESRNQWIRGLMEEGTNRAGNRLPSYARHGYERLKYDRGWMNIEPFNWDIAERRKAGMPQEKKQDKRLSVRRVDGAVRIDSDAWAQATSHELVSSKKNKVPLKDSTTFKVLYDDANLYVRVEADLDATDMNYQQRDRDAEIWLQECINFQIAPTGDKSQYYYFNYEPVANSYTDAQHGFITDPLHPKFGWNDNTWDGEWSYVTELDEENNKWVSMVTVPYKTLNAKAPTQGTLWMFNIARTHFFDGKEKRELSAWAEEPNVSRIPGDGYFGQMRFE